MSLTYAQLAVNDYCAALRNSPFYIHIVTHIFFYTMRMMVVADQHIYLCTGPRMTRILLSRMLTILRHA